MCFDPGTLSVIGTVANVIGGINQANQQADAYRYQAQVAENNRIIEEWKAQDALERGAEEEAQDRRRTQRLLGQQRAVSAASGFRIDEGSNLDILGDTALFGELDALNIRDNAERESFGYRLNASNFASQASAKRQSARNAGRNGLFGAVGTVLTGIGDAKEKGFFDSEPASILT